MAPTYTLDLEETRLNKMSSFCRESIHRAADALVQDTRSLVSGAGEDQNRLAGSTHLAVRNISQLADVVKQGAAVIGPGQSDSQVGGKIQ